MALCDSDKPHNPMINSGAIMTCSLIRPEFPAADRFDFVMQAWRKLGAGHKAKFSNSVYLSERQTADRNFALGYFMREHKAFPENVDLLSTLEFYFQCCSIEVTARHMSVVAATLANGGINPLTGEQVFSAATVKKCLSLMASCGMYDFSGEFAFRIGLPAKSGVSGAMIIVVPNLMGVCTWSPRLDKLGNSVRGIEFCKELTHRYRVHVYDSLAGLAGRDDPRRSSREDQNLTVSLNYACAHGDLDELHRLLASGADLNEGDYDGRTPLHLAASEGHYNLVDYLLRHGVEPAPLDRWGGTPLDDARRHEHADVVARLELSAGKSVG